MRGGVFADNQLVPAGDLGEFISSRNRQAASRCAAFLSSLPGQVPVDELVAAAQQTADPDHERLCYEYLPLHFSRRHGDPSRPWNRFAIHIRDRAGNRTLSYEGNWRDIFQNWEALCTSFPGFLPSMVAKFVNASTCDGFNPYRITRDGVDWETEDPDDPWSYIGYWGDHQIIYLLKFLEAMNRYDPGELERLLTREVFSYANVPYRIKPYEEILRDPHATIVYDQSLDAHIDEQIEALGADGKLVRDRDGSVYHVSLLEKLLVPALAKLSNLVPDGGIWMNTQRPEWNDANNALVGDGVSVVTLCYLRRYLVFLENLLDGAPDDSIGVSNEVADWLRQILSVLEREPSPLSAQILSGHDRKRLLDALGRVFSEYRDQVYAHGFSGKQNVPLAEVVALCQTARPYLDRAIRANRRRDGLYHSYLLLAIADESDEAALHHLPEMLEGQVAVLSSGVPDADEALEILTQLYASSLYRPDQRSFMLYPEKTLPGFLAKNVVPVDDVRAIPLLNALLDAGDTGIVARDSAGIYRFDADFANARDLARALDRLAAMERWSAAVARDRDAILDLFEAVFHHRSYTGRSGAMYAYEGLGCIYWHMVAKLLLAVQEVALRAVRDEQPAALCRDLARAYYRIRSGLGFEKTVAEYGAFPTDPYSHTPPRGGAKQPGMTGQVKEEILTRLGELGIRIEAGAVSFLPVLLRPEEFLASPSVFRFYDIDGRPAAIDLPAGCLAFSFCQVPIVYERIETEGWIRVDLGDGTAAEIAGQRLDTELSQSLFARNGLIARIHVGVSRETLCHL
jgi:hypothetical protein